MDFRDGFLNLREKGISDIHQITEYKHYKEVKHIDLSYNALRDISGLADLELEYLEGLTLEGNMITKVEGLYNFSNLKSLDFGISAEIFWDVGEHNLLNLHPYHGPPLRTIGAGNQIKEIGGLDELVNLTRLTLSFNEITEIKGLENLEKLRYLDLSFNYITEIKGLENQKELTGLYLMFNEIREIKGLENLKNLRSLDLNQNKISEVKGIRHLKELQMLFIGMNKIKVIQKSELPPQVLRLLDAYFLEHLENENIKLI